ncbi:hypothetical protein [Streptomyces sp. NPDC020747]|uniref:hypothetical protein n=1 Tax=Streptomyces sp. NPDC020747 TaxID=3365086 RepID=UPI003791B472
MKRLFTTYDTDGSFGRRTKSPLNWRRAGEELEEVDGGVGKEAFRPRGDVLDGP